MMKNINLSFEHCGIQLQTNSDSELVIVRVNDFVTDEERSLMGNEHFKEKHVVEIYPDAEEVREIIKALQQILSVEEME